MTNAPMSWDEYFETHPEFAKLTPNAWYSRDVLARRDCWVLVGNLYRMYFGESYLQRRIVEEGRGAGYYNQHRIAKGDTMDVVRDDVTWVGDDQLFATIRAAAGECDMNELWQRFVALTNRPKSRRKPL